MSASASRSPDASSGVADGVSARAPSAFLAEVQLAWAPAVGARDLLVAVLALVPEQEWVAMELARPMVGSAVSAIVPTTEAPRLKLKNTAPRPAAAASLVAEPGAAAQFRPEAPSPVMVPVVASLAPEPAPEPVPVPVPALEPAPERVVAAEVESVPLLPLPGYGGGGAGAAAASVTAGGKSGATAVPPPSPLVALGARVPVAPAVAGRGPEEGSPRKAARHDGPRVSALVGLGLIVALTCGFAVSQSERWRRWREAVEPVAAGPAGPVASAKPVAEPIEAPPSVVVREPVAPPKPPEPSPAFRLAVADLRISGAVPGEGARALINGKLVRVGDVLPMAPSIRLVAVETQPLQVVLEDAHGARLHLRF